MTATEIRKEMDKAIEAMKKAGNADKVAELEVIREYFTNPEFKAQLQKFTYSKNS